MVHFMFYRSPRERIASWMKPAVMLGRNFNTVAGSGRFDLVLTMYG